MSKIIFSALVVITAAFFTACNTEGGQSCSREPDIIDEVTFNLMDESFKADFRIWKLEINENYRESALGQNQKLYENLFQFVKKYCISKNITFENQLMAVVLYYDLPLSESLCVNDEHIKGISLYEVRWYRIIHRLYVRNERADFVEEENVKVAVPYITANHINFYLENYVFTASRNKSDIVIWSDLAMKVEKNSWRYSLTPMRFEVKPKKDRIMNSDE
ncbi:MAG: hypothetical protein FWC41_08445 [Firmicutes bacterium]|nr:hypothetical protein [Bacillota bacterium]